jgi:serine phosphatase RsbU (regulator of sigma subunit)
VLVTLAALAVSAAIRSWTGDGFFGLAYGAVVAAVWFGGFGPGLVTALACMVGARLLLLPPLGSLAGPDGPVEARWLVFVPVSLMMVGLGTAMWRSRARAELTRRQAEQARLQAWRSADQASLTADLATALDAVDKVGDAVETLVQRIAVGFAGIAVAELHRPAWVLAAHHQPEQTAHMNDVVDQVRATGAVFPLRATAEVTTGTDPSAPVGLLVRRLSGTSSMTVPLTAGGETLGTLLIVRVADAEPFTNEDLEFAVQLGARAGLVLANLRLREREHELAHSLQHSLLPRELPQPAGLAIGACYLPAQGEPMVGGDWYDVLVLPTGQVILAVGDISGHGVAAAASMGQLRSGLAGLALATSEPAALLDGAQRFIQHLGNPLLATLALVVLDPASGSFTYACAGHPPPMVVSRSGEVVTLWQGRSPLLGYAHQRTRPQGQYVLDVEDTLLLYTDGLVESRHENIDEGFARLAAQAAALDDVPIDDFCFTLTHSMLGERPNLDDVAVLALRRSTARSRADVGDARSVGGDR